MEPLAATEALELCDSGDLVEVGLLQHEADRTVSYFNRRHGTTQGPHRTQEPGPGPEPEQKSTVEILLGQLGLLALLPLCVAEELDLGACPNPPRHNPILSERVELVHRIIIVY